MGEGWRVSYAEKAGWGGRTMEVYVSYRGETTARS